MQLLVIAYLLVAAIGNNGDEIILHPRNSSMEPLRFPAREVTIYGRVVTVLRRL